MPRLENRNPNEIEKILFADYGLYLLNRPGEDNDTALRKYVPILDMEYARNRYKETGEWPEYLMPHEIDIVYSNAIVFDMVSHEVEINGFITPKCLELIMKLMKEWNWINK